MMAIGQEDATTGLVPRGAVVDSYVSSNLSPAASALGIEGGGGGGRGGETALALINHGSAGSSPAVAPGFHSSY